MLAKRLAFFLFVVCSIATPAEASEERSVAWLGFPIITIEGLPNPIDLTQPPTFESAFLTQLRRQAVLLTARDEFGAITRDAFLDETALEDSVQILDVKLFPHADVDYTEHRKFLADLEKLSRNEFIAEWERLGLKKSAPVILAEDADLEAEHKEIEKLLKDWALIPQFEAVRRTHEVIRQRGESLQLLKMLVRGYTQLQMLTNIAPRDTHRVFQARAMLYAQRAVAQYGETPETLSLRAAAWCLKTTRRLGI